MSLISDRDLQRARERYLQSHPEPPRAVRQSENDRRAKILVEIVREDASLSVAVLADAAERSPAWVRLVLQKNGIVAPEAARIKTSRNCSRCGHTRKRHCAGVQVPKLHKQKRGYSICPGVRHCAVEGCSCSEFAGKGGGGRGLCTTKNTLPDAEVERLKKERQFNAIPSFTGLLHLALEEIQPIAWGKSSTAESGSGLGI
jgi:hypothetical protein